MDTQRYIKHIHGNIQIGTSEIQGRNHAIQDTATHLKKSFHVDKNNKLGRQNLITLIHNGLKSFLNVYFYAQMKIERIIGRN